MKETKRIVQSDNWSCAACVVAMITGETVEDVFAFMGHDGSGYHEKSNHPDKRRGFTWLEMARYLIKHRYIFGTWAIWPKGENLE